MNNPWSEYYENWPARNEKEARALKLLSEGHIELIIAETGMSHEEFRDFILWAKQYEIEQLCVADSRRDNHD